MHAWLCENPVGVDALTWKELPTPQPGPGEVLIEIKATGICHTDEFTLSGADPEGNELVIVGGA